MNAVTLYELAGSYRELLKLADEEVPEEAVRDTLEALEGEIQIKAENVIKFAQHLGALQVAIEEAAERMQKRAATIGRRVEALRAYVLTNMQATGISKIECPEFVLSVQKNPPSVVIDAEGQIPTQYMVQPEPPPPRPDKKAIADAIKRGETVAGCHLQQTERLKVR